MSIITIIFTSVLAYALLHGRPDMTAVGVVDVTGRLAADVLRTVYWSGGKGSIIYAIIVWTLIGTGVAIIATGATQPLILLVISAAVAGFMMFIYSALLLALNGGVLDQPLRTSWPRVASLGLAVVVFGGVTAASVLEQIGWFAN